MTDKERALKLLDDVYYVKGLIDGILADAQSSPTLHVYDYLAQAETELAQAVEALRWLLEGEDVNPSP